MTPDDHQPGDVVYVPTRLEDEERLTRIHERYLGKFEELDFNERDVRAQLAFDLGFLIGTCARLLAERPRP